MSRILYLIGSLRNDDLPSVARSLRERTSYEIFDDWYAAGPEADDCWRRYEQGRGHSYVAALDGFASGHIFEFDRAHLARADVGVLVLPAGKSAHLELGWMIGRGKPGYVLLDNPDRWDVMYKFATKVCEDLDGLVTVLGGK